MWAENDSEQLLVVVRAGGHRVGFRVQDAIETMRPLPTDPVPAAPRLLRGVAVVRGEPMPVIDLRALLDEPETPPQRWLTLRGARTFALAVDAVEGVLTVRGVALPPLLRDVERDRLVGVAARDREVIQVLRAAVLLDDEVLARLEAAE